MVYNILRLSFLPYGEGRNKKCAAFLKSIVSIGTAWVLVIAVASTFFIQKISPYGEREGWLKNFQKTVKRLRKRLDNAEWLW